MKIIFLIWGGIRIGGVDFIMGVGTIKVSEGKQERGKDFFFFFFFFKLKG